MARTHHSQSARFGTRGSQTEILPVRPLQFRGALLPHLQKTLSILLKYGLGRSPHCWKLFAFALSGSFAAKPGQRIVRWEDHVSTVNHWMNKKTASRQHQLPPLTHLSLPHQNEGA